VGTGAERRPGAAPSQVQDDEGEHGREQHGKRRAASSRFTWVCA
jgi:hypothetical protein